jgi:amino acid adenylation domain-containing protein
MSDLRQRIANLSAERRALFERLMKKACVANNRAIPRRGGTGPCPLSFSQQRLWFLDQYERNSSLYNVPGALRLRGSLNVAALEQSLNELIRRHESLRTTFSMVEAEAVQIISPSVEVPLSVVDLAGRPKTEREEEALRLVREEARRPFDLAQGPLFRSKLLQLDEQDHVLLLTMHHIVSDGWSIGVLHRELSMLYRAFVNGEPSPLAELPIQYADFAVWQREWLQGEVLDGQLSYWKKQLEGIPAVLNLPTDYPRPAVQSYRGGRQSIELSRELTEGFKAFSRKEGATLFMTLLAAFQALLYRYTGQDDIVIGSPIANRNRAEIEGLIGFFVNTLVLRSNFSDNPTFKELLATVREMALGAYAHQDLPFEKLVEELQPERSLSHSPLFQVMFVLQNAPKTSLTFEGLSASPVRIKADTAKFDLTLSLGETGEELSGSLEYNSDLFDGVTIDRLLGHFQILLEGIIGDPDQRISELPLMTQTEQHQLVVDWNDTEKEYPKDKCIHQLFETQVEKSPDRIAVLFDDQQLTYRELNERANQLGRYLRKLGVGPEVLVAICVERSLEMVVGILGILKAGGTYVPLDPSYPKERLRFMLEDTQVAVLLTQQRLANDLIEDSHPRSWILDSQTKVVCLDADWKVIAEEGAQNPVTSVTPEHLAYVIYTSGSTGTPKGVEIQHRALINLVTWHQRVYNVTPTDRATQLARPAFDASVWELWPYLTAGASIHILNQDVLAFPSKLLPWLAAKAITICFLPTPLAQAVLEEPWPTGLVLRVLLTGGDKLHRRPHQALPFCLANNYGPTENTVVTTWAPVMTASDSELPPPIGRPIFNTQVYLLDSCLQPVAIGITAEIYISGDGLARGYLRQPDLTAEKFVPNPFSDQPGGRLYKTGDLARYRPDSNIEFLGRTDNQLKIRGFRIELGEIETVLGQHPAVRENAVTAREDKPGDKRLVAYAVLKSGQTLDATTARSFLKQKLPAYMVPSEFVFLDRLPLTQNGKLDRKALSVTRAALPRDETFTAARDELELQLTQIWEKVLRKRLIGLRDNFFDLGGHSLLAVRLISQVEKLTGRHLSLASLFQAPTIEDQAQLVRGEGWSAPWSSLVAIQPGGSKPPLFCVHAHDGNVLFWQELSRNLGPEQPFYGLQAHGLDGKQAPDTRIEDMASRYVREIRLLQPEGPYFLGGHCLGGLIAFEMAQQLHAQGQRVALVALMDSFAPSGKQRSRGRVPLRHRVERSLALTRLHVENLRLLGWQERLSYLEVKFSRLLYKIYMSVGTSWLLAAQARRRILAAGVRALRNYNPKVYPGALTLFRATELPRGLREEPQNRWVKLAGGGLEVHLIPGYFSQTVYEPRVRVLAEKLTVCLDRAHSAALHGETEFTPAISRS